MTRRETRSLIGESPAFLETLEQVSRVAPLDKPVLVVGERGTGKEMTAERLHFLSSRWDQTLIKLNCAALPETLLESELFGYESGAFTGAGKRHQGRFERADGGTLFLDEISSMSLRLQEKLLRIVEYGEFERVGGDQVLQVDVRIVGAANADLPKMAAEGAFRPDLLDRLSFDVVTLPPLRYRQGDIMLLSEYFALGMAKELRRAYFPGFSTDAAERLIAYPWPGNLRELKNVVERAVYRNEPDALIVDIAFDPFASPYRPIAQPVAKKMPALAVEDTPAQQQQTAIPVNFRDHIATQEKAILEQALKVNKFNQKQTAKALALTYDQLRGLLKKHHLL